MTKNPLLVIAGETASGKSSLAIDLARQLNGEIICADSSTLRRGADIGTAKPTHAEQAMVPHHLLDIIGPGEKFTAAQFKQAAEAAIKDIAGRDKLPIMAGGSGLYIDSVIYDYSFFGKGEAKDRKAMIHGVFVIGLKTEREVLRQRIETRLDAMLAAGLAREVRTLADNYGWDCEALKAVGYAQWKDYFDGSQTLEETHQKIIKANMDLAKRQRTWFKRNKSIHWFSTPINLDEVVESVTTFLS